MDRQWKGWDCMANEEFIREGLFEQRFWLQIMGDHARFLLHLIPIEVQEDLHRALQFRNLFDQWLERSRKISNQEELMTLTGQAIQGTMEFRSFKLQVLTKGLKGTIHISTTFINHMVNELEEYLRVLGFLKEEKAPPITHSLHHHLLWLSDAAGHAAIIESNLDMIEKKWIDKSRLFHKTFDDFYIKAIELAGYLRTGVNHLPALTRFDQDAALEMHIFKGFLEEIEKLELEAKLLGAFMPLMADHMGREECYYLIKLAQSTGGKLPACDPTKPRVEK